MNDVLHANIFFFITSVVTILFGVVLLVCAYYVLRILRDVSKITAKINKASAELEKDFEELRTELKHEGGKLRAIVDLSLGFFLSRMKKPVTPRKRKIAEVPEVEVAPEEEALQ